MLISFLLLQALATLKTGIVSLHASWLSCLGLFVWKCGLLAVVLTPSLALFVESEPKEDRGVCVCVC